MLRWRVATGLTLAPIVLGAIALGYWSSFGYWTLLALVLIVVARSAFELARALNPLPFIAALGAGAMPVLFSLPFGANGYGSTGVLAGAVVSLPWTLLWLAARPEARTLRAILAILLMTLWVGVPLAHMGLLAGMKNGVTLILISVVGPWISDAGAYFTGLYLGRHLLFPSLSPNKTVEGSVGGLVLATLAIGWVSYQFLGFSIVESVVMGAVVSCFSQSGDLFESLLKRLLDLKDLGRALPGHGGLLDRIDSILFTIPAVYYLLLLYEIL